MSNQITIIIPTKNEEKIIQHLIEEIKRKVKINYQLVFVDDSTDNTREQIKKFCKKYNLKFKLVRGKNEGLANAILLGLNNTKTNLVCVLDADLQHPPEKINDMYFFLNKNYSLVIGSRFVRGAKINFSFYRRIISKFSIILVHLFLPKTRKIKDPTSGFFAIKKPVKIPKFKNKGFKVLIDLIQENDFKNVKELPIYFKKRKIGKSKLGIKEAYYFLKQIFYYDKNTLSRFIKFSLVGLSGVFLNEFILWIFTELFKIYYLLSGLISIEASIVWNFTFNFLWTFKERRKNFITQLVKDNFARIFTLLINLFILFLFTEVFKIYYLISNLLGIFMALFINFIFNNFWIFKK